MNRRLKILISAYACSPYKGSEPGVGWGFVAALAKHHDLWVIVEEEKFRADIEHYLDAHPEFSQSVHFFFLRKQRNRALRKLWPPSYYWYYRRWHWDACQLAQRLHHEIGFDLAHQLTMVGFREPGYLWQLGLPFVWGPIGGMGSFPWRFLPVVGVKGACYYLGYNLMNFLHARFLTRPRKAARTAANGLLAATPENQAGAMAHWGCPSTLVSEVGLPGTVATRIPERHAKAPLRLVWTGQHTYGKALNLALLALSMVSQDTRWELHILGQGTRTDDWKKLAEQLQINDRCFFHGWLARQEALGLMGDSHVMLITSLRDLTSTVSIEALALGLPIICLDHCGFAHAVNENCGLTVPVTTPAKAVADFAAAIERLAGDEPLRQRLAEGAMTRARDFAWEKKAEMVNGIYAARMHAAGMASRRPE